MGFTITLPLRITQVVCRVRSTQNVSPEPALQRLVSVVARRFATSYVVGPARPWGGRMSYRFWNFLMAAQSAADCRPSTVTRPKPPSCARYVSTARWCSPCGQPAGLVLVLSGVGAVRVGFGFVARLGVGFAGVGVVGFGFGVAARWSGPGVPFAPVTVSAAPTGAAPRPHSRRLADRTHTHRRRPA